MGLRPPLQPNATPSTVQLIITHTTQTPEWRECPHLKDEIGDEGVGLQLTEVVVLLTEREEEELDELQGLHQHTGVGVEEAQREPLEDEVQAGHHGGHLRFQILTHTHSHFSSFTYQSKQTNLKTSLWVIKYNIHSKTFLEVSIQSSKQNQYILDQIV